MNIGNILKVADAIEQASVPGLGFNMASYVAGAATYAPDLSGHACGTVACIAGWACAVQGIAFDEIDSEECAFDVAQRFFKIPEKKAFALFLPETSAAHFTSNKIMPQHAIRALRNLAITGKVDWEAAMKGDDPVLPPLPASRALVKV